MKGSDFETAGRLIDLLEHLDQGGTLTLASIKERFGVKEACARGYIDFIKQRRPNLSVRAKGRFKEWFLPSSKEPSAKQVQEAAALDFARRALMSLEGTDHHDHLTRLAEQSRNALGDQFEKADRIARSFHLRPVESPRNPARRESLKRLMKAIEDRRECYIRYESAKGIPSDYDVQPWGWLFHRDELFLVAGKKGSRPQPEQRLFSLDRVLQVDVQKERFTPRNIEYDRLYQDTLGIFLLEGETPVDVHLRVRDVHAVRFKYRAAHSSQRFEPADDGWSDLYLRIVPCPQLTALVLSLLPDVQVVAPASLASEVQGTVDRWLQLVHAPGIAQG